jgi:homoserine dehydrogenase
LARRSISTRSSWKGSSRITIEDIEAAAEMGYRIKLLGVAQMTGRGLEQRMSPCLVPSRLAARPA